MTPGSTTSTATSSTASSWATRPRPSAPNSPSTGARIYNYEDLLTDGTYRPGMSGDGVAGGAFTTGFVVVPRKLEPTANVPGNIIYARPDYLEDPLLSSTAPDGSLAKPVLDPRA